MALTRPDASQIEGLKSLAHVTTYGAVGDGVTDDTDAINAASAAVDAAGGGVVYFPPGRYFKKKTSASLSARNNVAFRGAGMNASIIVFDDNDADPRKDLFKDDGVTENDYFELSDIAIHGSDVEYPSETNHSIAIALNNYKSVVLRNVLFQNLRNIAATTYDIGTYLASGCVLDRVRRGGLRFSMSCNATVTGCVFKRVSDDAVQGHTWNDPAAGPEEGITIVGNVFEQSQSVRFLGGRNLNISGNTFRRMSRQAIDVSFSDSTNTEGVSAVHNVIIDGNIITDTFGSLGSNRVIMIGGDQNVDVPLVDLPEDHLYDIDMHDPTSEVYPNFAVQITNNVITRTLPLVPNYADYGFDEWFDRAVPDPPDIDATTFNVYPIYVVYGALGLNISGNIISNGGVNDAIRFVSDAATPANAFNTCLISGNLIRDVRRGVHVAGATSLVTHDIRIVDNVIDCDPHNRNHEADGTWLGVTSVTDVGVYAPNVAGMVVERNTFKNVHTPVTHDGAIVRDNLYFCGFDPGGVAASNLGIRVLPSSFDEGVVVHANSNPNSATYGSIVTNPVLRAAAMPATGRYYKDHFVHNTNKSVLGGGGSQYVINGWRRLTTGETHVAGTDWVEVRTLTGT